MSIIIYKYLRWLLGPWVCLLAAWYPSVGLQKYVSPARPTTRTIDRRSSGMCRPQLKIPTKKIYFMQAYLNDTVRYDSVMDAYTLAVPPSPPWTIEKELNFSLPEPSSEMWHVCDDLHFAYKTLNGDGSITARIESIDQTHWQTEVGVMIRNTLEPTSENVAVLITSIGGVVFQYRAKPLEATRSVYSDVNNVTLPYWVRLTRKGNLFTAQHSNDGVNWHTVKDENSDHTSSVEFPIDEAVHIGLVITSHNSARSSEARMSNVKVTGDVSPNGPFNVSEDISLHSIGLQKN